MQTVSSSARCVKHRLAPQYVPQETSVDIGVRTEDELLHGAKADSIGDPDLVKVRPEIAESDVPRLETELPTCFITDGTRSD